MKEPLANFSGDPGPVSRTLINGILLNYRDSNGSTVGHDIERIHEQVDKDSLDALPVHRNYLVLWHVHVARNAVDCGSESLEEWARWPWPEGNHSDPLVALLVEFDRE